jgi:hypothetical protein
VRTRVKRRAMLMRSTWDYFAWVDDFRGHLEESWSRERFFERIQWPALRAVSRVLEVRAGSAPLQPRQRQEAAPQEVPPQEIPSSPTR